MQSDCRRPILVVGAEPDAAIPLVFELRRLGRSTVWLDTCDAALELLGGGAFGLVIVSVDHQAEWELFLSVARASECPVAVASRFLAGDRRYRNRAFYEGAAAYMCRPYDRIRLRRLLTELGAGRTRIELVDGAPYSDRSNATSATTSHA